MHTPSQAHAARSPLQHWLSAHYLPPTHTSSQAHTSPWLCSHTHTYRPPPPNTSLHTHACLGPGRKQQPPTAGFPSLPAEGSLWLAYLVSDVSSHTHSHSL